MKDPTAYIQSEFYRVLNGSLSVGGEDVPVSSLEQEPSELNSLFVNITTSYLLPDKSKDSFRPTLRLQLDVVNLLSGGEMSITKVEDVVNQICSIIIPTPATNALSENSDWGIISVNLYDSRYLDFRDETNYIVRKILMFEILTKQK